MGGSVFDQLKKKGNFGPKKQAGAELKKKKRIFGQKIGKKFQNKVQKLSNFKEKKDFFGQKNKLGLSLRTIKGFFWAKILIEIELKGHKLTNFQKKKKKKMTFR